MLSKAELRIAARARRKSLANAGFAAVLARHAESLNLMPGAIVGGYHAHGSEADPAALLVRLVELGCHVAFPRAQGDGPLTFHRVPDGEVLRPGSFGIAEPLAHWPQLTPSLLLVPLLAFDGKGTRLGQGGGHYDRTLEKLDVPAIGVAYAGQEVDFVPLAAHDRSLTAVLTELGLRRFS